MRKTMAMLLVLSMLLSMIPAVFAAETGMTAAEAEAAVEEVPLLAVLPVRLLRMFLPVRRIRQIQRILITS